MPKFSLALAYPVSPELTQLALEAENALYTDNPHCGVSSPELQLGVQFACTRDEGHAHPHVAHGFHEIVHVWEDEPSKPFTPDPYSTPIPTEPTPPRTFDAIVADYEVYLAELSARYDIPDDVGREFILYLKEHLGLDPTARNARLLRYAAAFMDCPLAREMEARVTAEDAAKVDALLSALFDAPTPSSQVN